MALIQSVGAWGSSPVSIASTQAGSTIIVLIGTTGAIPAVSDNLGTVYTQVSVPGASTGLYCFYARVAAGVNSISITNMGNANVFINEESGLASTMFDSVSVSLNNGSGATTWTTNPANVTTSSGVGYVFTQYLGGMGMTGFGVDSPWSVLSGTGITGGVVTNTSYGDQAAAGRRTISAAGTYTGTGFTGTSWYPDAFVIFFKSSPQMRMSSNLSLTSTTGGQVVTASDDFNRGDTTANDLGGSWGVLTGLTQGGQVLSNRASAIANFTCRNYYNVTLANDQYAEGVVANTNYGGVGFFLRTNPAAAQAYAVDFWGQPTGGIEIYYRSDSATSTVIANTAYDTANTVALGDIVKGEVVGNKITAYVNGVAKLDVTHNSLTSGFAGIFLDASGGLPASAASIDNFVAGNVTTTSSTTVNYGPAVQILNMVEVDPIQFTNNLAGFLDSTASSYVTASTTVQSNSLRILSVISRKTDVQPLAPTISGLGLTWNQVTSQITTPAGPYKTQTVFVGVGTSPTSGTITIDFGGVSQTTCEWVLDEMSSALGTPEYIQYAVANQTTSTAQPLTATLSALSNYSKRTYGFCTLDSNGIPTVSGGFTLLGSSGLTTVGGIATVSAYSNTSPNTSVTFNLVDGGGGISAAEVIGFEIVAKNAGRLYANGTYVTSQFIEA